MKMKKKIEARNKDRGNVSTANEKKKSERNEEQKRKKI